MSLARRRLAGLHCCGGRDGGVGRLIQRPGSSAGAREALHLVRCTPWHRPGGPRCGRSIFVLVVVQASDVKEISDCIEVQDREAPDCKASFLQKGMELQVRRDMAPPAVHNQSRTITAALAAKQNMSNVSEDALLQLMTRSTQQSASTVSTIINLVVLALLVALIVLLCRHDMNLEEAKAEVQEDPRVLYKQFERKERVTGTRSCQEACC
ncbi:unnamed protein product [Durusdinium trenchii]|uniref:Uncharacterized protein n=1 Tax=Durusdinium trenchii TaxID=1381693 RepID=A0ABP0QD33_9DINO